MKTGYGDMERQKMSVENRQKIVVCEAGDYFFWFM